MKGQRSRRIQTQERLPSSYGVSREGEEATFRLYATGQHTFTLSLSSHEVPIPLFQEGAVHQVTVKNVPEGARYHYVREDGVELVDPWAMLLDVPRVWGAPYRCRGVVGEIPPFDWEGVEPPQIDFEEQVIYEAHVRGFSPEGTYLGMAKRLPYLKELGVTTLELLPVFEFDETFVHNGLCNFWGYAPLQFFYPCGRYAVDASPAGAIQEFRTLVREAHRLGMEVVLDVVFNHTGEGDASFGRLFSHRGLAEEQYFHAQDYTGCGNAIRGNDPLVVEWIMAVLRHWTTEMQVDGFRFDLATVMARGEEGEILDSPPLLEAIARDPVLRRCKLIAEPWDAAGGYQVGAFYPEKQRWQEWNGQYRDVVRRFLRGDARCAGDFASRVAGSEDLYQRSWGPCASVNFVAAHDGFSLWDLVSYNKKHNEENREENRDGSNENYSWNCGVEGETQDGEVLALRERQWRNFWIALAVSRGVPMFLMGDERGQSKGGNNNTWCLDTGVNRLDWGAGEQRLEWVRKLLRVRRELKVLREDTFLREEDVQWMVESGAPHTWEEESQFVAWMLKGQVVCAFNASEEEVEFPLPEGEWRVRVSSWGEVEIEEGSVRMPHHSAVVLSGERM